MKIIEYNENGLAFPDAKAEEKAIEFLLSDEKYICVSTDNFILAIRCLILETKFPHDQVLFVFKGQELCINSDARITITYPKGFCDWADNWLSRLIPRKRI